MIKYAVGVKINTGFENEEELFVEKPKITMVCGTGELLHTTYAKDFAYLYKNKSSAQRFIDKAITMLDTTYSLYIVEVEE